MTIYIPSYGRTSVKTYENLPSSLQEECRVIVNEDGFETLSRYYPYMRFEVSPKQGWGAQQIKQDILLSSRIRNEPVCCLFDDDLTFNQAYFDGDKKKFRKATAEEIERGFRETYAKCLNTRDCGFTFFGSHFFNTKKDKWIENKKGCYALFINNQAVFKSGAKFFGPTMSDVAFMMSLATKGYGSFANSYLTVDDVSKSGTGGESAVPDRGGRSEKAIDALAKMWPEYIKPRLVPNNKRHMENMGTMQEITVYFSKAVKDAQKASKR